MVCEKYQELTPVQQIVMIGKAVHAMQNDNAMFDHVANIIQLATLKGVYDNVTILPDQLKQDLCSSSSHS